MALADAWHARQNGEPGSEHIAVGGDDSHPAVSGIALAWLAEGLGKLSGNSPGGRAGIVPAAAPG